MMGLVPKVHRGVVAQQSVEPRAAAAAALEHNDAPPVALGARPALPRLVDRPPIPLPLLRRRGGNPSVAQGVGCLVGTYHSILAKDLERSRHVLVVGRWCLRLGVAPQGPG